MKFSIIQLIRCLFCAPVRLTKMLSKSSIFSWFNKLNSLNRSRKIILGLFVVLVFFYYIGPKLFGFGKRIQSAEGVCMASKLLSYKSQIDHYDVVKSYVPMMIGEKNYPIYVGNGYIAASFDSRNGLYVRLNRALSVQVPFYPVIETMLDEGRREEVDVLQLRQGIANRIQVFNTAGGCVSVENEMYAHRSRPSLLVQEISMHNPTSYVVNIDLDQIPVSSTGWKDAKTASYNEVDYVGNSMSYSVTTGVVKVDSVTEDDMYIAIAIATTMVKNKQEQLTTGKYTHQTVYTAVQYSEAMSLTSANEQLANLASACQKEMLYALKTDPAILKQQHKNLWEKLWESGVSISTSLAAGAINGDKINSTIYYVLSNVPAPLHDPKTSPSVVLELRKTLHYPDKCYSGHTTLYSATLWKDAEDEDSIARIVTTWMITLEKQGCQKMISAGVEGVLQAMLLSVGSFKFGHDHLEMDLHPKDTHRDLNFHRINYGNNTHLNVSILVGEDNKANIFVSLDRNDKPYYACDAGCLDPPRQLSKDRSQFPVKLTEPLTAILYITADKIHMEEYKHVIHVVEIAEAPAHEHHVIALHRHGHHFGGLPTFFWVSIAFLVIVFHLFLFKLIYNEYCAAQERYTRGRYLV